MNKIKQFILAILLFILASGIQSKNIALHPYPEWINITPVAVNKTQSEHQSKGGVNHLLFETQTRVPQKQPPSYYSRHIKRILNPTGVETYSQIEISYSPIYQNVQIHNIKVLRGDVSIDKFTTAQVKILQQESEAKNLIYSGFDTLSIILEDIQVGDILEYDYTIIGSNPVFNNIFSQVSSLQWSVPVDNRRLRIVWEKETPLIIKQHGNEYAIKQTPLTNGIEYKLSIQNTQPLNTDSNAPEWYDKYDYIEFSESKSWKEIVNWGIPLFLEAIKISPEIDALAKKIKNTAKTQEEQITQALQFVQQTIRYLGIEIGVNSHKPSYADETLKRKYGDCKDKTVLFLTILKALKIEAYPALINTTLASKLTERLPSMRRFDHVIAKVILNDKIYWFDPTRQYQNTQINKIYQPDYSLALVLKNSTYELEKMDIDHQSTYSRILEQFVLPAEVEDKTQFSITTESSGYNAELNRQNLASKGLADLKDSYFNFYKDYYPGLIVKTELTITEDSETSNRISNESYEISNFWERDNEEKEFYAWFYADSINGYLSSKQTKNREDPLAISHPVNIEHIIAIKLDDREWTFESENIEESNSFFDYSRTIEFDPINLELKLIFNYRSKVSFIETAEIPEYDAALERIKDNTTYGIYRSFEAKDFINQESNNTTQSDIATDQSATEETQINNDIFYYWLAISAYFSLIIISLILWRIDRKRNPFEGELIYYPVSIPKFIVLSILTFGIYCAYWIYRNFKYIKTKEQITMMPIARGIFHQFWYYSLYSYLVNDSEKRFSKNQLFPSALAVIFAIIYLILTIISRKSDYFIFIQLVLVMLLLPLLIYINKLNEAKAIDYNSGWSTRHFLLFLFSLPIIFFSTGESFGFLPADSVISGDKLHSHDIAFMQRKKIILPNEKIEYFYSDAVLFIRNDGNGYTSDRVFSYWLDETDQFLFETALYNQIDDIEVTWSKTTQENTIIKIIRNDENNSYFLLFVSSENKKDKVFVEQLMKNWKTVSQ
ncbi:DUF3857 domain-containing protein [Aliikangiella maris]|uniref:DUF3857 domain-containing protein n=2 Tax=Aliikangiella maris TaxID=3162458 RepID=A0ABV3MMZ0_9GAMM